VSSGTFHALVAADVPDPCLVRDGDLWILTGTTYFEDVPDKLPLHASRDLERWEAVGHVFPRGRHPSWAEGQFWAPEIHAVRGGFRCYYTARERGGRLAIGVAVASRARGPYEDLGRPLVRGGRCGVIDAHRFADDDGRDWLFWKEDGNDLSPRAPTPIHVQRLAPDGLSLLGESAIAFTNDRPWEAHVVEGPWAVRRDGRVYVFYSGNAFHTAEYAVGVARANAPLGPYEKHPRPLLTSNERWRGPGHGCVVALRGRDHYVYHAWDRDRIHGRHPRLPLAAPIAWVDGWPVIG
jgi:beta-xylosidase